MEKWKWILRRLTRKLWVRTCLIGAMGIAAATLASVAHKIIPNTVVPEISHEAIDSLLKIIATSMLAVTTFSLSVMTSAFGLAIGNSTPRATRLLAEDRLTQNVLATFMGSFLFSIVGLVMLRIGGYGPEGRMVLFLATIAVLALIVIFLLRWINHLTSFGTMSDTIDRVETAAREAIELRQQKPYLGGRPIDDVTRDVPEDAIPVTATESGYVVYIDMEELSRLSETIASEFYVVALPGTFVFRGTPVAWIAPNVISETQLIDAARSSFTINTLRSFDQDPAHGVQVLSEIAQRALSPGINDPITAIEVLGRLARLLELWVEEAHANKDAEVFYPSIHVLTLDPAVLFESAFESIGRDGAGTIEVQLRIRATLKTLAQIGDHRFRAAAYRQAGLALERAEKHLELEDERRRLLEIEVPAPVITSDTMGQAPKSALTK